MGKRTGKIRVALGRALLASSALLGAPSAYASTLALSLPQKMADLTSFAMLPLIGATTAFGIGLTIIGTVARNYRKRLREAKSRVADLELLLNEAEASLLSEPQILILWRSVNGDPERLINNMRGTAEVPQSAHDVLSFNDWLERDSVATLGEALARLRETGTAFNIGIKTKRGELLEADGRAAGSMASLRIRPLVGERRQVTELSFDANKLAKQVERLSAILDSAPFPMWIKGNKGELSWANQAYVKTVEAPSLDVAQQQGETLASSAKIDSADANAATNFLGRIHAVQHGAVKALNIFEMPIDNGSAGFAIDVTTLENTEKELDRHIKAHASTLDKLDTAIAIFGPDQRLRFFNQAYAMLWGFEVQWLQEQPLDGEILDRLRTARLLPEQANYREWKAKQLSAYSNLEAREAIWYLPDRRSLRVVCEQHPFGGVTYLYVNLTKEYLLESRYNELFDVQRETLDNLAEAVALFGSDGQLRLSNPAFNRLWQVKEGTTPHVDVLARRDGFDADTKMAWQDIRYGITGLDGSRKLVEGRFSSGMQFLHFRAVPLPDGNALLTFTDVSDSVKAETALRERTEALEAADRLKTDFLANVSYEIRTPLTSIAGFSEALDHGYAGALQPKQQEYVRDIRNSAGDLSGMIDAIIDLSAIDAGAMELRIAPMDVTTLLERSAGRVVPALERRNQSIAIEIASNVSEIKGDAARLEQVLGHLLSNAIGFSQHGAKITMGARQVKDSLQIWVADTGRGMDTELQGKAFERFQSKPLPGSHRGPGLGLSIVKSFTELHGGKVSLVSKLDKGTTVVCTLPLDGPHRKGSGRIEPQQVA